MKAKDMIENYLIELGVSLKNNYTYIPESDYKYSSTKGKTETIKLGNYDVKLDKIIRNTREIIYITNIAKSDFIDNVTLDKNVGKACEKLMSNAVLYYAEFIKYISNNISIKTDLAEKLITLANGAMDNTKNEIDNVIHKFNVEMNKAKEDGARHRAEFTANAITEATKVQGYRVTGYERDGFFGDKYTFHASPITMSDAKAREKLEIASGAASQLQSIYEECAEERAIEDLKKVKTTIIDNFNYKLKELIGVKLDNYFIGDLFDNRGNNVGDNPTIYGHYLDVVNELKEEQLEDFKKAVEYYGIYLSNDLKKQVEDNIYNDFVKNGNISYNNIDYKAYVLLKSDEFGPGSNLATRIRNTFCNLEFKRIKENNNLIATFDAKKNQINECGYLSEDDKNAILKAMEEFIIKNEKAKKLRVFDIIINTSIILFIILSIFLAIKYSIMMKNVNGSLSVYCVFGTPVALFAIYKLVKEIINEVL